MSKLEEHLDRLEQYETVAVRIAREAGQMIKNTWGSCKSIETKQSFADLVTETDKNVEKFVFDELKRNFAEHKFIGEESVAATNDAKVSLTNEPTWIVDPVDGTMNFVHTFPYVAVAIGLAIDKKPVLGVVYCPAREQMFTGRRGKGAYCNGVDRLSVRSTNSLGESLICAELGSDRSEEKRKCVFENMQSISWQCHGIRALGSAAMNICAVASGQAQAYYEFGLHCWDMCAPVAILLEAGGFVCDTSGPNGRPFDLLRRRLIVACSEQIARQLSEAMPNQLELESD